MSGWILTLAVLALIAGVFGFGGFAPGLAVIAKSIFFGLIVVFVVGAIVNVARGRSIT